MNKETKRRPWLLVLGGLLAATVATIGAISGIPIPGRNATRGSDTGRVAPAEPEPVAVTVAPLTLRPFRRTVPIVGTFYGYEEVQITPKVEGRVRKVLHDVGDVVRPGEALLEVEETDYRLAVAEAQRALEAELAKLGLTELPPKEFDVGSLPTVVRADLLARIAQTRLTRLQRLRGTGASAQDELDQAQTDYNVAQATHKQMMMEAQATLATARHKQALLETARQRLSETRVLVPDPTPQRVRPDSSSRSHPVEYVVAQRMVSEGEMVRAFPSVAAFRLVMDRPLKLQAAVPERHVAAVKVGQPAEIHVESYPRETFHGTVARVNPTVDRANRTFQVEVNVPNEDRRLRAGSFAKAEVFTHEDAEVPTVPEESIVSFAGVTKLFVVKDGRAHAVEVQPGTRKEVTERGRTVTWVEIHGRIDRGASVVTSGHSQLAEGTPVRVREGN